MTKKLLMIMLLLMGSQMAHAMETYYEILGVSRKEPVSNIQKAYRKLAAQYHPDKTSRLLPAERLTAETKLKEITDAWDTLKDPQLKAAYDSNWSISDEATRRRNVVDAITRQSKARQAEAEAEFAAQAKKNAEPEHEKIKREKERAEREAVERAKREAEERAREQERIRKEQERLRKEAEERTKREEEKMRKEHERRMHEEAAERARRAHETHGAAPVPGESRAQAIERERAERRAKAETFFGKKQPV